MILLHALVFSLAVLGPAMKEAIPAPARRAVAAVLLMREPRIVWSRVEPEGGIGRIRTRPGGPEIPHGATMTGRTDPPGQTRWAYYYPLPTPLLQIASELGFHPGEVLLVATGREARTRAGRWREFRRCGEEEFSAALALWKRGAGG
ncbi:MAG: hypothetical protein ACHQ1G_03255 [Planctomycetota bacterium]